MGATAAFDVSGSNPKQMTYLLTGDGAATTTTAVTCSGAVTPDLITDLASLAAVNPGAGRASPLSQVIRCQTDGLGATVAAAAALTQAQARALFNSQGTIGTIKTPKLRIIVTPRSGVAAWSCDVNVALGLPIIEFTTSAAAGTWALRVEVATPTPY